MSYEFFYAKLKKLYVKFIFYRFRVSLGKISFTQW